MNGKVQGKKKIPIWIWKTKSIAHEDTFKNALIKI